MLTLLQVLVLVSLCLLLTNGTKLTSPVFKNIAVKEHEQIYLPESIEFNHEIETDYAKEALGVEFGGFTVLYDRGVGTIPLSCPNGYVKEYEGTQCWTECPEGFKPHSTVKGYCVQGCPNGYSASGPTKCQKKVWTKMTKKCTKSCTKKCKKVKVAGKKKKVCSGKVCVDACTPCMLCPSNANGTPWIPLPLEECKCYRFDFKNRPHRVRKTTIHRVCPKSKNMTDGLCYKKCDKGFTGIATTCYNKEIGKYLKFVEKIVCACTGCLKGGKYKKPDIWECIKQLGDLEMKLLNMIQGWISKLIDWVFKIPFLKDIFKNVEKLVNIVTKPIDKCMQKSGFEFGISMGVVEWAEMLKKYATGKSFDIKSFPNHVMPHTKEFFECLLNKLKNAFGKLTMNMDDAVAAQEALIPLEFRETASDTLDTRRRLENRCDKKFKCIKNGKFIEDPTIILGGQFLLVIVGNAYGFKEDFIYMDTLIATLKFKVGLYSAKMAFELSVGGNPRHLNSMRYKSKPVVGVGKRNPKKYKTKEDQEKAQKAEAKKEKSMGCFSWKIT